ncbi:NAD(P)H-dependent glycerol-3-phosphate dehydrogenase [Sphingomonas sp. MM-1]|uniref:NAD(P)H-dependent glycerol-3-phosphate dehydrogenase n=1 Tax=Sphingomonas sp. MM-1 TaxID=745310 RepID=UPI0002C14402|nr:NAD(P)H-dependent glycerol-3-phosphate dehydrogenase [Sphingomonas sp. MM-1]AGH50066.1 NAD(P)H-dependent glycerol-3-phosphate dehydrogenase [Sphingomonas sp. MM-1]
MIGIIGGGAWGTALAQVASAEGTREVRLWAREEEVVASINDAHENTLFLPGVPLAPSIRASDDLGWVAEADPLLVVTPSQHMRAVLAQLDARPRHLILCAKGIEAGTMRLMHEVAHEACPTATLSVLSGPTFAHEVAKGLPTAITLACEDADTGARIAALIARPAFRPYAATDVVGAEIGGAVKNVLAIACGVVEGRALGQNARAALISRGFAEMTRFGLARGARAETLAGLSGLGDLVLTCSSTSSRNFSLGLGLGQGKAAVDLLADRRTVAEGAFTAPVLRAAAREAGVDMPITEAVCALLEGRMAVDEVVDALLARPLRAEH